MLVGEGWPGGGVTASDGLKGIKIDEAFALPQHVDDVTGEQQGSVDALEGGRQGICSVEYSFNGSGHYLL